MNSIQLSQYVGGELADAYPDVEVDVHNPELTVHDLRMVPGTTHTNMIFDCVVPRGLKETDEEIKEAISALVKETHPHIFCVITIDHSYVSVAE